MGSCQSTAGTSGELPAVDSAKKRSTKVTKPADPAASNQGRAKGVLKGRDNGNSNGSSGGRSVSTFSRDEEVSSFRRSDDKSDASSIGSGTGLSGSRRNPKSLTHSSSIIGLDAMIENRREEGGITANVVHMEVPFGKPIEEVYDGIHSGPVLGSGISGLVRLVTHKATGVKYAVKCLDLSLVDTEQGLAQLREEIFIMCQLDHPNIVRLEEVYESHTEIYLVQELCVGGELFDRLDEQPDYRYTEAECARLIKQMLCAVRYLHSKGIIHRDLKLENFLFSSTAQDSELKMIDFGLSKHFRYGEVQYDPVGTPYTVSPEVIRGCYDERCDIWAIGVIAFLLLSGEPPFGGCGGPEPLLTVRSNILRGFFEFEPAEIWNQVSPNARHFISSLLVTNPKLRPTAQLAQEHSWLKEWADRARSDNDNVLNPNVVNALVNFKEFSDMRKLLCEVLSFTLLPEQIKDLRKEFETLDTDGSGEISLAALKQVLVTNAGAGSLGALTEEEVEDIFNAMRVKKSETRIHWHEFIAAGLSQCEVDDRNLRLAFDRLDNDHKGYVTLDDIMDLVGNDAMQDEEAMRKMWGDSMRSCNCSTSRITYEDFVLIMKGQTKENEDINGGKSNHDHSTLRVVQEEPPVSSTSLKPMAHDPTEASLEDEKAVSMDDDGDLLSALYRIPSQVSTSVRSAVDYAFLRSDSEDLLNGVGGGTVSQLNNSNPEVTKGGPIPSIPRPGIVGRQKSRSMNESEMKKALDLPSVFPANTRRAVGKLYRAHRQMRFSVMEASERFEEQQTRHARDILIAQQEEKNNSGGYGLAGLIMRRVENKTIPSEAVMNLLEQNRKEQQDLMEKASRLGGRGRRNRQKTISDVGGMLGSLTQDEMTNISIQAAKPQLTPTPIPQIIETKPMGAPDDDTNLRRATVPGEFRSVKDPFGLHGKYAAMLGDRVN